MYAQQLVERHHAIKEARLIFPGDVNALLADRELIALRMLKSSVKRERQGSGQMITRADLPGCTCVIG